MLIYSRLRDELLNIEEFITVAEARRFAERWQLAATIVGRMDSSRAFPA
jgi:hypothetical protein